MLDQNALHGNEGSTACNCQAQASKCAILEDGNEVCTKSTVNLSSPVADFKMAISCVSE